MDWMMPAALVRLDLFSPISSQNTFTDTSRKNILSSVFQYPLTLSSLCIKLNTIYSGGPGGPHFRCISVALSLIWNDT